MLTFTNQSWRLMPLRQSGKSLHLQPQPPLRAAGLKLQPIMHFNHRSIRTTLALVTIAVLLPTSLLAADIYRWVDRDGRTQLSDTVPDEYKKSATRIDSRQFELSDAQRREAEARAAHEKLQAAEAAEAAKVAARAKADSVAGPLAPASGATAASGKPAGNASDCATLQRLYKESTECFAPYRTAKGTTKAEAFDKCPVAVDPTPQCGYR